MLSIYWLLILPIRLFAFFIDLFLSTVWKGKLYTRIPKLCQSYPAFSSIFLILNYTYGSPLQTA